MQTANLKKIKHLKLYLLLVAMANIFASCKKDKQTEDQLPTATETPAGIYLTQYPQL